MKLIIYILLVLIFQSANAQWETTSWQCDPRISIEFVSGDTLIILSSRFSKPGAGYRISTDNGHNWKELKFGNYPEKVAKAILISKNNLIFGGSGYIYVSTDLGDTWENRINELQSTVIYSLIEYKENILAGTSAGLFISSDMGKIWHSKNNGFGENLSIMNIAFIKDNLIALSQDGIFLSKDFGENWEAIQNGLPVFPYIEEIVTLGENIFVSTQIHAADGENYLYYSSDMGNSWNPKNDSLIKNSIGFTLATDSERIYLRENDSIYVSTDLCDTWINIYDFLPIQLQYGVETFRVSINGLYASSGSELYYSLDKGNTWEASLKSINYTGINDLLVVGNRIFAATNYYPRYSTFDNSIFMSNDMGDSWIGIGEDNRKVIALGSVDNNIFASKKYELIFSSDYGETWENRNNGLPDNPLISLIEVINDKIIIRDYSELYLSNDLGNNWILISDGLPDMWINSIAGSGEYIYAGLDSSFYVSNDMGKSWDEKIMGLPESLYKVSSILADGNDIFFASSTGVFYSSDQGNNWESRNIGLPVNYSFSDIILTNGIVFLAIDEYGVYVSPDKLAVMGDYIFVGSDFYTDGESSNALYKAKISDLITGVNGFESLDNNGYLIFPNPVLDFLHIENAHNENQDYIIVELSGKLIDTGKLNQSRIDASNLTPGEYILKVGNQSFKFIKL